MNEFIEKLIGRLEEKANQTWLVLAERNGYERAIEIVNQLAEEYNNGWIPCSERLPEEHKQYDITTKNDAGIHSDTAIFNPFVGMWFWDEAENKPIGIEVLAWAEKREPYQPKGE